MSLGTARGTAPQCRSDRQPLAPLGAARIDDRAAASRLHANEKAMGASASDFGSLIGSFHGWPRRFELKTRDEATRCPEVLQQERPSIGNHLYGAFGRDFGTSDGRRVMVAAISAGQWTALQKACGVIEAIAELQKTTGLDFTDEGQRYEAREAIAATLEPWFAARTYAEVVKTLDANRVCWGPYQTAGEALRNDPRASLANPLFERIDTPGIGQHIAAGASVRVPGAKREPIRPAPLLGADTDAVLHDVLGLASGEIGRLHDSGIVAGPERDPTVSRA